MSEKPPGIGIPTPADFFNWMNQFAQPMIEATSKMTSQQLPATPSSADPLSIWKNLSETNEQALTKYMAQLVDTPEFAASLGRGASATAVWRDGVRKTAQAYLEAANMPSREDITRVAAQIVTLDAKIDSLEDRLLDDEGGDALDEKLDGLMARLEKLDQQAALDKKMSEMEARQTRLEQLETRLSAIETKLEKMTAIEARLQTLADAHTKPADLSPQLIEHLTTLQSKLDKLATMQSQPPTAPSDELAHELTVMQAKSEELDEAPAQASSRPARSKAARKTNAEKANSEQEEVAQ